jgi:hypothetical protein
MPQANVLRVGQLTSGALVIRFAWLVPGCEYCSPSAVGSGKPSQEAAGVPVTLLGPEGTDTRFRVCVVFRPLRIRSAGLVGWVRACGPVRPPYRIALFHCEVPVFVGVLWWGWGGLVVVWVGVRSCFENCIVNASIL